MSKRGQTIENPITGERVVVLVGTEFGLAQDGKTDAKGRPNLLQLAMFATEFDDVLYLTRPPRVVQRMVFGALVPVARLLGYRGSYPAYKDRALRAQPTEAPVVAGAPQRHEQTV